MIGPGPTGEPDVSVVILTMGDRPHELAAAITSVRFQSGVHAESVVVANGVPAESLAITTDSRTTVTESIENLGIPGGRNVGIDHAHAPIVAFLDDDARLIDDHVLGRCVEEFRRRPQLAVIALRIVDEQGHTARRHVPRVGARDPARSGAVTAFLGGAVVMRAAAFRAVGGYAAPFVYAMEETDLALRLIDGGWEIHYDGAPAVFHPAAEPGRHVRADEQTMRNRVWLAHRSLPAPIAVMYVLNWLVVSGARRPRRIVALARSTVAGWRTRPGPRSPIGWSTVLRLTRLGRPPVI